MAQITAQLVNQLRQSTGLGMNECKAALVEADGDLETAISNLRKKGVKAGVAARAASEGRLFVKKSADGKSAVITEVLCNTDFTARSEPITQLLTIAADKALSGGDAHNDVGLKDLLTNVAQKTGENVTLGRVKVLKNPGGKVGGFLYSVTNKIAVLASTSANASDELINDLCLHLTAYKPVALGLTREAVPANVIAKEKEIAVERAKATGKPQAIAEKIAEGQLASFFKERVLPEQEFINPEKFKGTIADLLKKNEVTMNEFVRVEIGLD
ncbi:MAG TPA: translation elongation factor Ts [Tepidisphaeraceae bacterium]|nr:translation elongation factor Ts [Tepidisphaeraceae bacterium]